MLYLFTNKFERKLNVLDCEGVYYKGLFGSENSFKIESDINDAKGNIAKCLCEKYVINKKKEYKNPTKNESSIIFFTCNFHCIEF